MDMYFEEKQKEKKSSNKHVNMILVQHNNPYAVMLERQIFAEAIEKGRLNYYECLFHVIDYLLDGKPLKVNQDDQEKICQNETAGTDHG